MHQPVVLIEILSPTNVSKTRANVRAYTTNPSVTEIVVVRSWSVTAEILRRSPDGTWPEQAEVIVGDGELRLESIGFAAPVRSAYRTTELA